MLKITMRGPTAEIDLHGPIGDSFNGGISFDFFNQQMRSVTRGRNLSGINISIHSNGGDAREGFAMYGAIKAANVPTVATVVGNAASAATLPMIAANEIRVMKNSYIMIHRPMVNIGGGTAEDLEGAAKRMYAIEQQVTDAYVERTGRASEEIHNWMDAETEFYGQQAIEAGFADKLIGGERIAASIHDETAWWLAHKTKPGKDSLTADNQARLDKLAGR